MLRFNSEIDLNNISLTGARAIAILGLLINKPQSLDEIRNEFIKYNIMDNSHSNDILRIDLNTLKHIGCKISRSSSKTNHKYVLSNNPFAIPFSDDDYKILKRVYDKTKNSLNLKTLIEFDDFFRKIADCVKDEEIKEKILGISVLKYYDPYFIKDLYFDCNNKRTVKLTYKKPNMNDITEKEIIAQKLVFNNDKFYLYGYDLLKGASTVLHLRRIVSVLSRKNTETNFKSNTFNIRFLLKDFGFDEPAEEEKVVEKTDNGYIVEGAYYNEFYAMQRVLSFGSKCTVIEPIEFKNSIISKLKEMRKIYES